MSEYQVGPKTREQLETDPKVILLRCENTSRSLIPKKSSSSKTKNASGLNVPHNRSNLLSAHKNKSKRKEKNTETSNKIFSLFGSHLEDLDTSPIKVDKNRQRSMRVSLPYDRADFLTLINKNNLLKRKSSSDIKDLCSKTSRVEKVEPLIENFAKISRQEYVSCHNLITILDEPKTATEVVMSSELYTATMTTPDFYTDVTTVTENVIDLTRSQPETKLMPGVPRPMVVPHLSSIKSEISASESAKVPPSRLLSMPLFSPIVPVPELPVVPEKSHTCEAPRVELPKEVANILSQLGNTVSQTKVPSVQKVPEPPSQIAQQSKPPRMYPLNREYLVVSNVTFANKIFPFLRGALRYRVAAEKFIKDADEFLIPWIQKDHTQSFRSLYEKVTTANGQALINELLSVDVENFDISYVIEILSKKLHDENLVTNKWRIIMTIDLMIYKLEKFCSTPFTYRFYNVVKMCRKKIQQKSQGPGTTLPANAVPPLFSKVDFERLCKQIQSYHEITRWVATYQRCQTKQRYQTGTQPRQPSPSYHNSVTKLNQTRSSYPLGSSNTSTIPTTSIPSSISSIMPSSIPPILWPSIPTTVPNFTSELSRLNAKNQFNSNVATNNSSVCYTSQSKIFNTRLSSDVGKATEKSKSPQTYPNIQQYVHTVLGQIYPPTNNLIKPPINENTVTEQGTDPPVKRLHLEAESQDQDTSEPPVLVKAERIDDEIIDLTWLEDGDESQIKEECDIPFSLKKEVSDTNEERESRSPTDSGISSPHETEGSTESYICICGNGATFICACKKSMYCSSTCQNTDWAYHQRLCNKN